MKAQRSRGPCGFATVTLTPTPIRYFCRKLELGVPGFSVWGSRALDHILPKLGFGGLLPQTANWHLRTAETVGVQCKSTSVLNAADLRGDICPLEGNGWWVRSLPLGGSPEPGSVWSFSGLRIQNPALPMLAMFSVLRDTMTTAQSLSSKMPPVKSGRWRRTDHSDRELW